MNDFNGVDELEFEAWDDNPQTAHPNTFIEFGMDRGDNTGTMLDAALPGGISLADLADPAILDPSAINFYFSQVFGIVAREDNGGGFVWGFNGNDITGFTAPTFELSVIPLPAPVAMAGVGLLGVVIVRRGNRLTAR